MPALCNSMKMVAVAEEFPLCYCPIASSWHTPFVSLSHTPSPISTLCPPIKLGFFWLFLHFCI